MAEERVQRKLAAILAADVVGYSRLMGDDETGTLAAVTSHISGVFEPEIAAHNGRIFKLMGDAVFAEFASVVDAVECAVSVQDTMQRRNDDQPGQQRIDFRIGVNLGDIIVQGDDIFGDGVNVASRLESLAEPGGICISEDAHRQVFGRLNVEFVDIGDRNLKNIARSVRAYKIVPAVPGGNELDAGATAFAGPEKPSIAVLPFNNLSGDPEQEYFSDGMAEDLIIDLSKLPNLSVSTRNSSFSFKGQMPDLRKVADKLGVTFVLEGSVRKMGEHVRINAQLISAADGKHLWADRFDGEMSKLFDFQDQIRAEIVAALEMKLNPTDLRAIKEYRTDNIEAYDLYLKGRDRYFRYTPDATVDAIKCFERAIKLDPNFGDAYGYLSYCIFTDWVHNWSGTQKTLIDALNLAEKGVSLDPKSSIAHTRLAWIQGFLRRFDDAIESFKVAQSIAPDSAEICTYYGEILNYYGESEKGLELCRRAVELDPYAPPSWEFHIGRCLFELGRLGEAIEIFVSVRDRVPNFIPVRVFLVFAYALLERFEDARKEHKFLDEKQTNYRRHVEEVWPIRSKERRSELLAAVSDAGLLDQPPELGTTSSTHSSVKPSIAVLPFDNLSGDPEQEYFSDGITEDIITALSRIRQFFVIARNTTFTYKRQAVDVQAVAKDLGIRYVLEGSVRKSGNRVRITAQLIEGESGNHIWAERYDRELEDIFAVQDEITTTVVGAIQPELSRAEQTRARRKSSENLDAWELYQKGVWHIWRDTREDTAEADRLLRNAIELDPEFCLAHAFLAFATWRSVVFKYTKEPKDALDDAFASAKRAAALDSGDAHARWALGVVYMQRREHELATEELEKAIKLNPSFASAYQWLGWTMAYDGQPEEAIRKVEEAQRLSPNDPSAWGMMLIQAQAYLNMKEFGKAERLARQAKRISNTLPINCTILASSGHTGNKEDADALLKEVLAVESGFTAQRIAEVFPFGRQGDLDLWIEGLQKAGVPD